MRRSSPLGAWRPEPRSASAIGEAAGDVCFWVWMVLWARVCWRGTTSGGVSILSMSYVVWRVLVVHWPGGLVTW